jgi:hypothetical protein
MVTLALPCPTLIIWCAHKLPSHIQALLSKPSQSRQHAAGASAAITIGAANRLWDENKEIYREYTKVKADITQQIIKAVDPVYFVALARGPAFWICRRHNPPIYCPLENDLWTSRCRNFRG